MCSDVRGRVMQLKRQGLVGMSLDIYTSKLDDESEALVHQCRNAHIISLLLWLAPEFIQGWHRNASIGATGFNKRFAS